ncbi:hypothetical protein LQZ21_08815 [Treponema sp. TIM-1]|uniref:hypothetical protein n=1 Tax=Treponema sp. TIM-1 TaxID=2898417 RepID=UPI00397F73EF
MKKFKVLMVLCGIVLWITGCPVSVGENLSIYKDENNFITYITDYNLQTYVPIPSTGEAPVSVVNRGDLDVTVVWKDHAGVNLPSLAVFQADTVYGAEIKLTPKAGYGFDPSIPFAYHPGKITSQVDDLGDPTRTVTVVYNNSDDADITFITDYNLQSYVPVPIADERPVRAVHNREDMTITAAWKVEDPPDSDNFVPIDTADSFAFELGAVYRAVIELTTKPNYRFSDTKNFTYTDGSQAEPDGSTTDPGIRKFTVTYLATRAPMKINDYNLTTYLAKPVSGTTAAGSFAASQYTGIVSWRNTLTQAVLAGPFQYGTAYTAEVALTPASGYTISGVGGTGGIGPDVFIHTGAETVTNPAGSGVVTIKFPPTSNSASPTVVYDTILTNRIPRPVNRATPAASFSSAQYTGTVVWKNTLTQAALSGHFQTNTLYTAVISLTALPGYTFTGIGQNAFTHAHASGEVINPPDSGTVTISFPPAGPSTHPVTSFGPVDAPGSALKLMKDRKDDNNPVFIDLPGGEEETVIPNTVELLADYNSPANITIDGNGRVLKIQEAGALITVRTGITLTLLNITLQGTDSNNKPLVIVETGGKLILGAGAVLTGNKAAALAGGVWVNGGELTMSSGAVIKRMSASSYSDSIGAGVMVDMNGKFTMSGGIIGGESLADGNVAHDSDGRYAAGGVSVQQGAFTMYGGTIQYNKTENCYFAGGGVSLDEGTFLMYNGSIKENLVTYTDEYPQGSRWGAGGVFLASGSSFTMNGADAAIAGNEVVEGSSEGGGGVYGQGSFTLAAGTIRGNTVRYGGGGVEVGNFTMSGGTIQDNTVKRYGGGGVNMEGNDNFTMSGGVIKGNRVLNEDLVYLSVSGGGVNARGYFTMSGGTIGGDNPGDANTAVFGANGVCVSSSILDRSFIMSGGTITGNVGGPNNYGVYIHSYPSQSFPYSIITANFRMSGSAVVAANNLVFLKEETTITIDGNLSASSPVANVKHETPGAEIHLLKASTEDLITGNYSKFSYAGDPSHIAPNNVDVDGVWYADYVE